MKINSKMVNMQFAISVRITPRIIFTHDLEEILMSIVVRVDAVVEEFKMFVRVDIQNFFFRI